MELIQGLIQPPKVQSADETIPTLSDRAESATLIGDRRSAVLGLKAFSRDYREAVVASGLKPLLNTLKRDFEDEATVKAILETLLILFIRGDGSADLTRSWISQQSRLQNGKYPSPLLMKQEMQQVDQFSLWIADAITQSDEIVHLILELLETGNFHVRLYTIQLLEAVVATRPLRARNAINSLPTGVSTLVSLLDDAHEVVRDEAVLLLMAVVNDSPHVQKLVAFENIFDKLFSIIDEEGGLRGSLVVSDCLSLINNILKFNTSNQSLFLETGNLPKLARILDEPLLERDFFWNDQRIINIKTALDIVSLTVEPGSSTTRKNQSLLLESDVMMIVLRLAFYDRIPKRVRPIALLTAASIINGNEKSQQEFGKIDVPFFDPTLPVSTSPEDPELLPVVELLTHWVLFANSVQAFQTRVASLDLIKAYLYGNEAIQEKFLSQQIEAYRNGQNNGHHGANILEAILEYDPDLKLNPFKIFFAADLLMFLFDSENKANGKMRELMLHVKTGAEIEGVESLSSVQTLSELLTTSLSAEDIRVPISYATLLIFWLYGDQKAVDEFLSERSIIQSLSSFCYQLQDDDVTIKCLVTMLLGVSYEFSSKESPFPRKDYHEYLTKTLGQDNYLSRINQFKEKSLFTKEEDKGTIFKPVIDETGLPQVYFSPSFVQFFNDNSYRIKTVLLRDPEEEPILNLSFDLFEKLQNECIEAKEKISSLEESGRAKIVQLTKEYDELQKAYQLCNDEKMSVDKKHSSLIQKSERLESELAKNVKTIKQLEEEETKLSNWKEEKTKEINEKDLKLNEIKEKKSILEKDLSIVRAEKEKAENGINKMNRELLKLTKENENMQETIKKLDKAKVKGAKDLDDKQRDLDELNRQYQKLLEQNQKLLAEVGEWEDKFRAHDELVSKLTEKLRSVAENLQKTQKERENLLTTLKSLKAEHEQSLTKYKDEIREVSAQNAALIHGQDEKELQLQQLRQSLEELEQKSEAEKLSNSLATDELEAKLTNLKKELQSLSDQKDSLEKENGKLKENIAEKESSRDETSKTLQKLEKDLRLSNEKVADLQNENQTFKEELRNKQASHALELERERSELEDLKKEKAKMSSLVTNLEKDIADAKARYVSLEQELTEVQQNQKDGQDRSSTEIAQLKSHIEKLKDEAKELKSSFKQSNKEKDKYDQDLKATRNRESNLLTEINSVKADLVKKTAVLEEVEKAKEDALSQLRQAKETCEKMKKDYKIKTQDLQSKLKEKTKDFEAERRLLAEGSNSATREYSEKVSTLEDKVDKVEKEHENTKLQLEKCQNNFAQFKDDSEAALKTSKDEIQSLDSENVDLKKQAEKTNQEYRYIRESTEKEKEELTVKLQALERICDERSEKNNILQNDFDKMKKEFTKDLDLNVKTSEKQRIELEQRVKELTTSGEKTNQSMQSQIDALSKNNKELKFKLKEISEFLDENEKSGKGGDDLRKRLESLKNKAVASEQASVKYKDLIAEHEDQARLLAEKNSSLSVDVKSKESELLKLKKLLDVKDKEADASEQSKLSEIQELKDQLGELKKHNEELLKKSKNDSEVDDLMLLVTDLDERNARYRRLLQTHGIDLPSDIDDVDDEEDDEEDDDSDEDNENN